MSLPRRFLAPQRAAFVKSPDGFPFFNKPSRVVVLHSLYKRVLPAVCPALWGALDPQTDILYLYSEHNQNNAEPAIHAQGIRSRGKWIPGLIDPTANGRSQSDGWNPLEIYQDLGLTLEPVEDSEQSGVCEVLQRMRSGRLKVFGTLENFFQQYRLYRRDEQGQVVKQNDLLMNCLRHLCVSGSDQMITEPKRSPRQYGPAIAPNTPQGWME